jgi:molecular chaperone DnaK
MTKEAELNAAEDAKRKEAVETKNQLDTTIYQLEKTLKDAGDKLPADVKGKFEAAIADGKKDLESNDPAKMKASLENLSKIGAELYQQAQAAQAAAGASPGATTTEADPSAEAQGRKEGRGQGRRRRRRDRRRREEVTFVRARPRQPGRVRPFNPPLNPNHKNQYG